MKSKFINSIISSFIYFFVFLCVLPIFILVISMFVDTWIYPNILPNGYTLEYISYVLLDNELIRAIWTSFIVGVISSAISVLISIPTARVLALYNFRGKMIINILVLLPLIVPSFSVVSINHINMIKVGLAGTVIGVSIVHSIFAIPYAIRLLYDQTLNIGTKFELQSKNLGASNFQTFTKIYLPLMTPAIVLAFFLSFTISISQYVTTLIIGGGNVLTLSALLIPYIQYGRYQIASIYSLILVIMSFLGYFFINLMQKKISKN